MCKKPHEALVVLGPTASGKTSLAVRLAREFLGEILSADSRQVYRGLDIGAGKDLDEYKVGGEPVPYHLIDIADLASEFNVFAYQQAFHRAFAEVKSRGKLPIIAGGTGLYLEAVLSGYNMVEAPEDPVLRKELGQLSDTELLERLYALKPDLHNSTDLVDRERTIRAIEIAVEQQAAEGDAPRPIEALVLGVRWPRAELRQRIAKRLKERLAAGLVEEVEALHKAGVSWERLELLGLEYRFVAQFLEGAIKNKNDLFQKLNGAITRFAKRQGTWFRRMERRGVEIHWIDDADFGAAATIVRAHM